MRKILFSFGLTMMTLLAFSQAPLSKGEKQLNFGLGASDKGLPVYVGMDFSIHNDVTVGPVVKFLFDDEVRFGALARVDYHWNKLLEIPSNWDFYLGANVSFLTGDELETDFGLQIGGRWYWSDKWGLNLEFGGGNGYGSSIGVSMKL